MKDLHESDSQSCFNDTAFTELTRMILKGTYRMKLDKIVKFLSALNSYQRFWREQMHYYERLNVSDGPLFCSFFYQV